MMLFHHRSSRFQNSSGSFSIEVNLVTKLDRPLQVPWLFYLFYITIAATNAVCMGE